MQNVKKKEKKIGKGRKKKQKGQFAKGEKGQEMKRSKQKEKILGVLLRRRTGGITGTIGAKLGGEARLSTRIAKYGFLVDALREDVSCLPTDPTPEPGGGLEEVKGTGVHILGLLDLNF